MPVARATGSKSSAHLFAIAQRKRLSEAVTDMLVERGDREVVHSVVKNSGAHFSDAGFRMLVKRSAGDDDLATVVGLRSDIRMRTSSCCSRRRRVRCVPPCRGKPASRGHYRRRRGRSGWRHPQRGAQGIARLRRRTGRGGTAEPHPADRRGRNLSICARAQIRGDGDRPVAVVRYADRRRRARVARSWRRDRADPRQGRGAVVVTTTKAILLLRAAHRGMSAHDLEQALSSFTRLQPDTARRVLGFFRTRVKKPAQPMVPPAVAVNG